MQSGNGGDRLLTLAQAAQELGLNPSRLRQLIGEGRLQAMKPGHDYLILASEIQRWQGTDRDRRRKETRPALDAGDGGQAGEVGS